MLSMTACVLSLNHFPSLQWLLLEMSSHEEDVHDLLPFEQGTSKDVPNAMLHMVVELSSWFFVSPFNT